MDKIMVQIKYLSFLEAIPHESLTPWKHDSLWDHQNSLLIAECLQKESCNYPDRPWKLSCNMDVDTLKSCSKFVLLAKNVAKERGPSF